MTTLDGTSAGRAASPVPIMSLWEPSASVESGGARRRGSLGAGHLAVERELDPAHLCRFVGFCRQLDAELHDARHRFRNLLDLRERVPRGSLVGTRVGPKRAAETHDAKVGARRVA